MSSQSRPSSRPSDNRDHGCLLGSFVGVAVFFACSQVAALCVFVLISPPKGTDVDSLLLYLCGVLAGLAAFCLAAFSYVRIAPLLASLMWVELGVVAIASQETNGLLVDLITFEGASIPFFWKPTLFLSAPWIAGLAAGYMLRSDPRPTDGEAGTDD